MFSVDLKTDDVMWCGLVQPIIRDQTLYSFLLDELIILTLCLVMVKTITMGERQESVAGIAIRTFIVQLSN